MEVKIEKLVYGGEGLAHHDGAAWFVPFVLPGERVAAQPYNPRKKFTRASLAGVLSPSPDRAAPSCPHFTVCGGCQYQHMSYEAQLRYKTEILRETLERLGGIRWSGPVRTHPSPGLAYRNRAQWKLRPQSGHPGRVSLGYFRAHTSALCPVEQCPVLSARLAATLQALRGMLERNDLPSSLREIEAFVDDADESLLLNFTVNILENLPGPAGGRARALAEMLQVVLPTLASILVQESNGERMELEGPGYIRYQASQASYRVGHLSFFQVNRFLVAEMARAVAEGEQGRLALDLYAGVGLFAVALAQRFERVIAVESDPAAARDLQANLEGSGTSAHPINAEAEQFLAEGAERPDLVVLDPPRAGVSSEALGRLTRLEPARITYLSCDPSTLARDLAGLVAAGYDLVEIRFFDVFPQTYHIESLVRLQRAK